MEPLEPLRVIPGPGRINRRLPDGAEQYDKDLERDARTNDPKKREQDKEHSSDQDNDNGDSGGKPRHHGGADPNLGKHLDLDG